VTKYWYSLDDNHLHKVIIESSSYVEKSDNVKQVSREEAAFLHAGGAKLCNHPNCFGDEPVWSTT
jgi:hypothetical protein